MRFLSTILTATLAFIVSPIFAQIGSSQAPLPTMSIVLEGAKKVNIEPGYLKIGDGHMNGSAYVPLVGGFFAKTVIKLTAPGEFADAKAPAEMNRISLPGYSPKKFNAGKILIFKPEIKDGDRYIELRGNEIGKSYWKPFIDIAQLSQTDEGSWYFDIKKPLPAGHYLIGFLSGITEYWDFDVK